MSVTIVIIGNITKNPELATAQNGVTYSKFNLAVDRYGQRDKTDYYTIVAWDKIAENITKFTEKGSLICVVGTVYTNFAKREDGTSNNTFEVQAHNVKFLSKSKGGTNNG